MKIKCKMCGNAIEVDEYDIQFCRCGAYYIKKRNFEKGWKFGGFYKGGKGEKEEKRQYERKLLYKKRSNKNKK